MSFREDAIAYAQRKQEEATAKKLKDEQELFERTTANIRNAFIRHFGVDPENVSGEIVEHDGLYLRRHTEKWAGGCTEYWQLRICEKCDKFADITNAWDFGYQGALGSVLAFYEATPHVCEPPTKPESEESLAARKELEARARYANLPVSEMSLREFFAATAMQGILAGLKYWESDLVGGAHVGKDAVRMADALIDELRNSSKASGAKQNSAPDIEA